MVSWEYMDGKIRLLGLLVVLPLLLWFAGYRKTVDLWWDYRETRQFLLQRHRSTGIVPVQDRVQVTRTSLLNDGKLLGVIGGTESGVRVIRYTPVLTLHEDGFKVYTGELIMSGNFHALLAVTDRIERECTDGRVVSLLFRMVKDQQIREEQLQLTLWIQQISEC